MIEEDERLIRQLRQDKQQARRPRKREEPPDEPAASRTPSTQEVLHRAEALVSVSPPVDTAPTPINDTEKINAMARMGGDVEPFGEFGGLGASGPTQAGADIERQIDAVLEGIDGIVVDRRR